MSRNIAYQTDELVRYFSRNRITWSQFYESERTILDESSLDEHKVVLDLGCGCGGLGLALRSATAVTPYERLCFGAFAIRKAIRAGESPRLDLRLPAEIRDAMDTA